MTKYKGIPIAAAKRLAEQYDKQQVIVVTWDREHGMMHVTTYGETPTDCKQAAAGGTDQARARLPGTGVNGKMCLQCLQFELDALERDMSAGVFDVLSSGTKIPYDDGKETCDGLNVVGRFARDYMANQTDEWLAAFGIKRDSYGPACTV